MNQLVSRTSSFISSTIVFGLLAAGLWWFYTRVWDFSHKRSLIFAFGFLLLSDGLHLLIHAFFREHHYHGTECAPKDLTVVLATYNAGDAIAKTIEGAQQHVPPDHILIASDTSTDNTVEVAASLGARIHENEVNLNK